MVNGSQKKPRILLLRTWLRNIGNGFIDLGAYALVKKTFPEAEVIQSSGYSNLVSSQLSRRVASSPAGTQNFIESPSSTTDSSRLGAAPCTVGNLIEADFVVLPGCVLGPEGLGNYRSMLSMLAEQQTPLILLGSGGSEYDVKTEKWVRSVLAKLTLVGMITRDMVAFQRYRGCAPQIHAGIDCAFFLKWAYIPPTSDVQFIAATFDQISEPQLSKEIMIVRPNHEPFGYAKPFQGAFGTVWRWLRRNRRRYKKFNFFVSDRVEDYLFVYANAETTYADRVHACIPALVYGKKAQFFFETPRAHVFDTFFGNELRREPQLLDQTRLHQEQDQMSSILRQMGAKILNL